jgi:hypothetical protein
MPQVVIKPHNLGELAQLAERVLSMHEVAGSIPAFSRLFCCQRLLLAMASQSKNTVLKLPDGFRDFASYRYEYGYVHHPV